ncbi:hypothetical protein [Nocardia transvalensis]|uniref:hypothetical protein n=1 Tax=Nocardia transvalensis TaxID=37333 RepID=UPI0018959BE1|nr:hypothetical protein [Nocardia transvalensis]MBF6330885.1 hypothetical protein [Nocardia transvalensis]
MKQWRSSGSDRVPVASKTDDRKLIGMIARTFRHDNPALDYIEVRDNGTLVTKFRAYSKKDPTTIADRALKANGYRKVTQWDYNAEGHIVCEVEYEAPEGLAKLLQF